MKLNNKNHNPVPPDDLEESNLDTSNTLTFEEVRAIDQRLVELFHKGYYAEAIPLAEKLLQTALTSCNSQSDIITMFLDRLADLYLFTGNYRAAIDKYKRSLKIKEKTLGHQPVVAKTLNLLAYCYCRAAKYSIAIALYKKSLAVLCNFIKVF